MINKGRKVAIMKDKKSKDCATKDGNKSFDMRIPTNKLLEKSGEGNNKNPPTSPIKIEKYANFSLIDLS